MRGQLFSQMMQSKPRSKAKCKPSLIAKGLTLDIYFVDMLYFDSKVQHPHDCIAQIQVCHPTKGNLGELVIWVLPSMVDLA